MSLQRTIVNICQSYRDGSFATRADREKALTQMGRDLHQMGFGMKKISNLKPHHVKELVKSWQAKGLANSTQMNRLSNLRWLADKLGKNGMIESNQHYEVGNRVHVSLVKAADKVAAVGRGRMDEVRDPRIRMSLELQKAFGLRREEATKINPAWADRGDVLHLKGSWTKGGKSRDIPIRTAQQRELLERAKGVANGKSLIPDDKKYVQHIKTFERACKAAGYDGTHGYRYSYAQSRYTELTGRLSLAEGGPARSTLWGNEREKDTAARAQIARELGHERHSVTSVYLGG